MASTAMPVFQAASARQAQAPTTPIPAPPAPPATDEVVLSASQRRPSVLDEKRPVEHVGALSYGATAVADVGRQVGRLVRTAGQSRVLGVMPLLSIGVGCVEGYNAVRAHKEGRHAAALNAGGNAASCFGVSLEAGAMMALSNNRPELALGLGLSGAVLGLAGGALEIKNGLQARDAHGCNKELILGVIDISSGLLSLAGLGVALSGHGALGIGLMAAASALDVANVAVDYTLARKSEGGTVTK